MAVSGARAEPRAAARVLGAPHRYFFLTGAAALVLASTWWMWTMLARAWLALPAAPAVVQEPVLHALLMSCGFVRGGSSPRWWPRRSRMRRPG